MGRIRQTVLGGLARRFRPMDDFVLQDRRELVTMAHRIDKTPFRMMVPTAWLRMQGGFAYGPGHPFVAALRDGAQSFRGFYGRIKPATLAQYYDLDTEGRGADLPPWEIPWYGRAKRLPPPGERNLGAEHGVSFYGPCTDEKISLELARLNGVVSSIQSGGYDPDAYGDIEGYVMTSGTDAAFFVRGGKHRTAALAHLGHDTVAVRFRAGFPRVVDARQSEDWPMVRDGAISADMAAKVLNAHICGRDGEGHWNV